MRYRWTIKTGDDWYSGTDANVFLSLSGLDASMREVTISDPDAINDWEKGDLNHGSIETEDLGELQTGTLRHDQSGPSSGWKVDWVKVQNEEDGREWTATVGKFDEGGRFPLLRFSRTDDGQYEQIQKRKQREAQAKAEKDAKEAKAKRESDEKQQEADEDAAFQKELDAQSKQLERELRKAKLEAELAKKKAAAAAEQQSDLQCSDEVVQFVAAKLAEPELDDELRRVLLRSCQAVWRSRNSERSLVLAEALATFFGSRLSSVARLSCLSCAMKACASTSSEPLPTNTLRVPMPKSAKCRATASFRRSAFGSG